MKMLKRPYPALWKTVGWGLLAVLGVSTAVLWSWNTLAVDLFALPHMQFRHALAAVLLAGILGAIFALGARQRGSGHAS